MKVKDLGPLPKVHPRHVIVAQAQIEIDIKLTNLRGTLGLTTAEFYSIVLEYLARDANSMVKQERRVKEDK